MDLRNRGLIPIGLCPNSIVAWLIVNVHKSMLCFPSIWTITNWQRYIIKAQYPMGYAEIKSTSAPTWTKLDFRFRSRNLVRYTWCYLTAKNRIGIQYAKCKRSQGISRTKCISARMYEMKWNRDSAFHSTIHNAKG